MELHDKPSQETKPEVTKEEALGTSGSPGPKLPKKQLIIIAIVIAALLIGIAVVTKNRSAPAKNSASESTIDNEDHDFEATVIMDENGFTPGTLAIKPETEVFFENHNKNSEGEEGRSVVLVQSKDNKDQVPQFEPGHIQAEGGYGYTFRKQGTYKFYNADSVTQAVTITVL